MRGGQAGRQAGSVRHAVNDCKRVAENQAGIRPWCHGGKPNQTRISSASFSTFLLPLCFSSRSSCAFIAATFAENHLVPYLARPEPGPGTGCGCKRVFLSLSHDDDDDDGGKTGWFSCCCCCCCRWPLAKWDFTRFLGATQASLGRSAGNGWHGPLAAAPLFPPPFHCPCCAWSIIKTHSVSPAAFRTLFSALNSTLVYMNDIWLELPPSQSSVINPLWILSLSSVARTATWAWQGHPRCLMPTGLSC